LSAFVLDASTVLAWLLRDERADEADALIVRATLEGAAAPRLMCLEVPNGLRSRIRRGALTAAQRDAMLDDFAQLAISWDDKADPRQLAQLSDERDLTIYDACYLALATRLRIPLATLDRRLAQAARAAGLSTIP
jgi:predicted nucleic acid-binding protein